ncbi:PTS sugar transporter subunit IIA [Lachnospiraceae bacterium 54-53]
MQELLCRKNVCVNCIPDTKDNIVKKVGQMLVDSGYVEPSYIDAMLKREESLTTYMGNGLALPHGVESAKKDIKASGIAVMIFPEGVSWGSQKANIVIGVAGVGDEHIEILASIAEKILDEETMEQLIRGDAETVYQILSK